MGNILEQMADPVSRGFREALKYSSVTTVLDKFCNVELALFNKYGTAADGGITLEHPEGIRKYVLALEKEWFGTSGIKVEDAPLHGSEVADFVRSFSFSGTKEQTVLTYHGAPLTCGIYLRQPRGNSIQMQLQMMPETSFLLQHYFNIYPAEGFLISFAREDGVRVSFCPESKDGKKGCGDVYVYASDGGRICRAPLVDYVPTAKIVLELFRG